MTLKRTCFLVAMLSVAGSGLVACGDDDDDGVTADAGDEDSGSGSGGRGSGGKGSSSGGKSSGSGGKASGGAAAIDGGGDAMTEAGSGTLCSKYGGAEAIATAIKEDVVGEIAGDCRINEFFLSLSADKLTHVSDCLAIQAQELFGCPGVTYAGSESSVDTECRSMKDAHAGLDISKGDFDALIEDVVAGLSKAGVEEDDIMAAAPALLMLEDDIVEMGDLEEPSLPECTMDGGADAASGNDAGDAGREAQ